MNEDISKKFSDAIAFMKAGHEGQTRKDGKTPYETHPIAVADLVSKYTNNPTLIEVALFHDLEEHLREGVLPAHPEYGLTAICKEFGEVVSEYVFHLTDQFTKENYPELNRAKRKQAERERYGSMPSDAKLVKLADVVANLRDDNGDAGFMQMYIREKIACLPYLKIANPIFEPAVQTVKEKATKYGIKVDSL